MRRIRVCYSNRLHGKLKPRVERGFPIFLSRSLNHCTHSDSTYHIQ
jgi:hypothetical protein